TRRKTTWTCRLRRSEAILSMHGTEMRRDPTSGGARAARRPPLRVYWVAPRPAPAGFGRYGWHRLNSAGALARAGVNESGADRRASTALVRYGHRPNQNWSASLARSGEPPEQDPIRRDEVLMATVAEGNQSAFATLARA